MSFNYKGYCFDTVNLTIDDVCLGLIIYINGYTSLADKFYETDSYILKVDKIISKDVNTYQIRTKIFNESTNIPPLNIRAKDIKAGLSKEKHPEYYL